MTKIRSILCLGVLSAGCFEGPSGAIPDGHGGDAVPVVLTWCTEGADDCIVSQGVTGPLGLSSSQVTIRFGAFDADSTEVMLWEKCPYESGSAILNAGYSLNGGNSFFPIAPADLRLDGSVLVTPACEEVADFDDSLRISASDAPTGAPHVLNWSTRPYVPDEADVIFLVALNDDSFTSDPGHSEPFLVSNSPALRIEPAGSRPGDVLAVELLGYLTTWGITTVSGGSGDNITLSSLGFTSATEGTATLTHGPDPSQMPHVASLVTPGAGIPSGDEVAEGLHWTCPALGAFAIEYETESLGDLDQFLCDQVDFRIEGYLTYLDADTYVFVAGTTGTMNVSMDWASSDSATNYDLILAHRTPLGIEPIGAPGDFNCGECCDVSKPEVCSAPVLAGETYLVVISYITGDWTGYEAAFDVP